MLIDFNETKEITIPGMNGGTGTMSARMFMDEQGKIIPTKQKFIPVAQSGFISTKRVMI